MAAKYGKLPSEILEHGTTIDLFIFDTVEGYKKSERDKAEGKAPALDMETIQQRYKEYKDDKSKGNSR